MSFEDLRIRPRSVEINGREYLLEYDFSAYALLEELAGASVFALRDRIFDNTITLKELLIIFYCALLKHQTDFDISTLKELPRVGAVLRENLESIYAAFFEPLLPPEIENRLEMR